MSNERPPDESGRPIDSTSYEVERPDVLESPEAAQQPGWIRRALSVIWRGIGFLLRPAVAVAVLYVVLFALFLVEKDFDDERRDVLLEEDKKLEGVITQQGENLEGILCLAQRVDILIDAELTGANSFDDLSPADLEAIQRSCAEQLDNGEDGAQSSGD